MVSRVFSIFLPSVFLCKLQPIRSTIINSLEIPRSKLSRPVSKEMSETVSSHERQSEPAGIDPDIYRQHQDRIIGLDEIDAWENIMRWINWIQAYIVLHREQGQT